MHWYYVISYFHVTMTVCVTTRNLGIFDIVLLIYSTLLHLFVSQNSQHHCHLHHPLQAWLLQPISPYVSNFQLNCLQHIQNSPGRAVVRAPISSQITPALRSLHWLQSTKPINYISHLQSPHQNPTFISVNLAHSRSSASSKANNCHFCYSGINLVLLFAKLLIISPYHSPLISHVPVHLLSYHHRHHPSHLFSSTPVWKLIFSAYPPPHSSAPFSPTRTTLWTAAVF